MSKNDYFCVIYSKDESPKKKEKRMNKLITMSIPEEWKPELERLARIQSVEENVTLTYLDLIRRLIKEKYFA